MAEKSFESRCDDFVTHARKVCEKTDSALVAFNQLFGVGAPFGKWFTTKEERLKYRQTPQAKEVDRLLDSLGDVIEESLNKRAYSGRFSIRVPVSVHQALEKEAEREGVSLNTLCLSKLTLQLRESVT